MTHIFKVKHTGNSNYLKLNYIDKTNQVEHTLGYYSCISYILQAAKKYFTFQYKQANDDTYVILWPKYNSISITCRDIPEEAL